MLWSSSMSVIHFYGTRDEYGFLSNFASHSIFLEGKKWPTTEHYFQAAKFEGTPYAEQIRRVKSPSVAAELGRSRKIRLRSDWESVKDSVMYRALQAKFTQHTELGEALLATGDAALVEHTERDSYWGDGGDGSGKNMLGRQLMRLRDELRSTRM